jgi:hypothetical protein
MNGLMAFPLGKARSATSRFFPFLDAGPGEVAADTGPGRQNGRGDPPQKQLKARLMPRCQNLIDAWFGTGVELSLALETPSFSASPRPRWSHRRGFSFALEPISFVGIRFLRERLVAPLQMLSLI